MRAAMRPNRRSVWVETPTNPLLNIADIEQLGAIAHETDALLVVDNTFASPYLQQPLALGADVVVHSTTKYLGGHSDVIGGALVAARHRARRTTGVPPERHGCGRRPVRLAGWCCEASRRSAVRMDRHNANAAVGGRNASRASAASPTVYYPGLPDHPGHDVAAKQMRGFGGMVSFRVTGGEQAAWRWSERTQIFTLAESLGGVESLIEHPGRMTHASVAGVHSRCLGI